MVSFRSYCRPATSSVERKFSLFQDVREQGASGPACPGIVLAKAEAKARGTSEETVLFSEGQILPRRPDSGDSR